MFIKMYLEEIYTRITLELDALKDILSDSILILVETYSCSSVARVVGHQPGDREVQV